MADTMETNNGTAGKSAARYTAFAAAAGLAAFVAVLLGAVAAYLLF